jgi:hypothetical protein
MKKKIIQIAVLGLYSLLPVLLIAQNKTKEYRVPFDGIETNWQNGSDRRDSSVFNGKYFIPSILVDLNYTHSFNNPNDNTVIGSTALSRNNEVQLSHLNIGGDFMYENVHARVMSQFGMRSIVVPRNDLSPYRGQYRLADVYRYLSEAYAGIHINNRAYGVNIDAGLFLSYIGLNSYYQVENWDYQASFTSDNTPWFFNGVRIQIFPSRYVKIEPWIINGWQSYGKFNKMPGLGFNFTWMPNNDIKALANNYFGTDAGAIPDRKRFHSDNSFLMRYYNNRKSTGLSQAAFSLTGDLGFEKGGGVNGFNNKDTSNPAQYFLSAMFYNMLWFNHNKFAWYFGAGVMTNPGRYLVLYPTGQASPLPNPNNPTQTEGLYPFSANPGDKFTGWDASTGVEWLINQSFAFKAEYVHRHANVPYFAGPGGVTSPDGFTTTPLPPNWRPDLVKSEDRIVFAVLFRL